MTSALFLHRLPLAFVLALGASLIMTSVAAAQLPPVTLPAVGNVVPALPPQGAPPVPSVTGVVDEVQSQAPLPALPVLALPDAGVPEIPPLVPTPAFGLPELPALPVDPPALPVEPRTLPTESLPATPPIVQQLLGLTNALPSTPQPGLSTTVLPVQAAPPADTGRNAGVSHSDPVDVAVPGGFGDAAETASGAPSPAVIVLPGEGVFDEGGLGRPAGAELFANAATVDAEPGDPATTSSTGGVLNAIRRGVGNVLAPFGSGFEAIASLDQGLMVLALLALALTVLGVLLALTFSVAATPRRIVRQVDAPFGEAVQGLLLFYAARYRANMDDGAGRPGPIVRQLVAFYTNAGLRLSR